MGRTTPEAKATEAAPERAGRPAPTRTREAVAAPLGLPASATAVLDLQRAAGNIAVQRLMTTKEFKDKTSIAMAVRGQTLKDIEKKLDAYHAHKKRGGHLQVGPGMDKGLQILHDIVTDTDFWERSHKGDKSRSKKRAPGILELQQAAKSEIREMMEIRKAGATHGMGEADFEPEANKFVAQMQGDASSILENLSRMISLAIPKAGDSVSGELTVKIPCDSYKISYVGFRILAEAARMDNTTTNVRFEVAVNGGANIAGMIDVGAELGFFLQSQGATPEQAMKLISYGWYRKFRESLLPMEVANYMWGGSMTAVGWNRSEQWAANIEKEAFSRKEGDTPLSSGVGSEATTNQFVRMGMLAGVNAEAGLHGVLGVEAAAGLNVGTHYDQKSVEAGKKKAGGQLGEALPMRRGDLSSLGTSFMTYDTSVTITGGLVEGEIAMSLEVMARKAMEGKWVPPEGYISLKGSLTADLPPDAGLLPWLVGRVKDMIGPLQKGAVTVGGRAKTESKGQVAGPGIDKAAASLESTLNKLDAGGLAAGLASIGWSSVLPSSVTLSVAGGYQFGKTSDGWTVEIGLSQDVGFEASAGGQATIELSKSSRLLRIIMSYDKGFQLHID